MPNSAFIDGQNLYQGVNQLGWRLDTGRLRAYLDRKYRVSIARYFVGYLPGNESLYRRLTAEGYQLHFKPVVAGDRGAPKGNVDADLVLEAMIEWDHYDQAVLVSGDGDFYSLARHLAAQNKLAAVLSPNRRYCSALLKRAAGGKLAFVEDIRHLVEVR